MKAEDPHPSRAACRCGQVVVEVAGPPIASTICCCESCRTAGRDFERASSAPVVVRADGGTEYCLYRKDRVRVAAGGAHLQERRLTPASPTRRVLATCCATPMFLDFTKGHWVSVYRERVPGAPPPDMRVMAKAAPAGARVDDGVPTYPAFPGALAARLLAAWVRMGLRRPTLRW
jgi:hypothetical protein